MIVGIIERIENIEEEKPFNSRYYLTNFFKEIFDEYSTLLIPIVSEKNMEKVSEICDCLIVTGSCNDIHPKYYNEQPINGITFDIDEFKLDKKAIKLFSEKGKPILGICGGLQSINVYFGGSLNQNIENHYFQNSEKHEVSIIDNSFLHKIYKCKKIFINSFHHQSVKRIAEGFKVSALSNDGIIEAIECGNIIGVQWHPEEMGDKYFFKYFLDMCKK